MAEYCRGDDASLEGLLQMLEEEPAPRVYRLPVFQSSFCQQLLEELQHFEKSPAPKGRPNTMNHHGILVDELGLDRGLITPLRERFLQPVAALLFPDCGGRHLDSHRAFVVKYALGEDRGLGFHYDNAEVTLNLCLGEEFSQGELYFGDMREVALADSVCREVAHRRGAGLLHRGEHMHGALPLAAGRRWNLVVWMRASRHRNQRCPMCRRPPARVGGRGYADGFTMGGAGPGGEEPGPEGAGPEGEGPEGAGPEGEGPGDQTMKGAEPGGATPTA
ncbi:2-oxoglutarate and iron-dependent oxygenase domain-containing protein 2 [Menidia menidia]